jgi:hypothetical protein
MIMLHIFENKKFLVEVIVFGIEMNDNYEHL